MPLNIASNGLMQEARQHVSLALIRILSSLKTPWSFSVTPLPIPTKFGISELILHMCLGGLSPIAWLAT